LLSPDEHTPRSSRGPCQRDAWYYLPTPRALFGVIGSSKAT